MPLPRGQRLNVTSGTLVATALLALLVSGVVYRYWPSDDRAVRRHLVHLAEALSVPGKETEVQQLTRLAVVGEYFAEDVRIVGDGGAQLVSREAVIGALLAWQPPPGGFSIEVVDQTVSMGEDGASATIMMTAQVVGKDVRNGQALVDARDLAITMTRVNRDWVITRAELLPAVRPSPR